MPDHGDAGTLLAGRADLAGKVAIVLGGAGGLGESITRDLAACGVVVAVADRDPQALAALREELASSPALAYFEQFDVRDSDALASFFEAVDTQFGCLDILVNVPGGSFQAEFLDTRPKGWDAVMAQNFTYVLHACHLAATRMRAGGGGSIVNVTSIEGHRAIPYMAVYGAMKAAVTSLTRTLALELGPSGIRINCVAPDVFPTTATIAAGWNSADGGTPVQKLIEDIAVPIGRFGQSRELSTAVLFLASAMSSYLTGTTLHVDGGTMASSGWFKWPDGYSILTPEPLARYLMENGRTVKAGRSAATFAGRRGGNAGVEATAVEVDEQTSSPLP